MKNFLKNKHESLKGFLLITSVILWISTLILLIGAMFGKAKLEDALILSLFASIFTSDHETLCLKEEIRELKKISNN